MFHLKIPQSIIVHFGNTYFCEQVFLAKHRTNHACNSAICYELDTNLIKQLCNFTYYPSLMHEPTVLGSGLQFDKCPLPWTFSCTPEK